MNIKIIAKQWLIDHGHTELDFNFQQDYQDLIELIENVTADKGATERGYDPNFGDEKLCLCGHPYYRHFDTYDNMADIGCKYCTDWPGRNHGNGNCVGFKLAPKFVRSMTKEHKENCPCKFCTGM